MEDMDINVFFSFQVGPQDKEEAFTGSEMGK